VGRLCTREKYLRAKGNAHELFWGISAFLPGEFKNLRKGLVDPFSIGTVKEKGRGEEEFKTLDETIFFILPATNSSISSFLTF
jgi:hypothetical protein